MDKITTRTRNLTKVMMKMFNPLWVDVDSFAEIIMINFFYPFSMKITQKKKVLIAIFFYSMATFHCSNWLLGGYLLNFEHKEWKILSIVFSYDQKTPFILKIGRAMFSLGVTEVVAFRFYITYLKLRRRNEFEDLLKFESTFDEKTRKVTFKLTELSCLNVSLMGVFVNIAVLIYGFNEKETISKLFTIIATLISVFMVRFLSTDIYLICSYVALIVTTILKSCNRLIRMIEIGRSNLIEDQGVEVVEIANQYKRLVFMINKSNNFVASCSIAGKSVAIPMMALTWFVAFKEPNTIYLMSFKWLSFILVASYSLRAYLLDAYLSIVHSKSKILYSSLNSIIARDQLTEKQVDGKVILLIIENISGRLNQMSYRDAYNGIVEQRDVFNSIYVTFEFILLLINLTSNNKAS